MSSKSFSKEFAVMRWYIDKSDSVSFAKKLIEKTGVITIPGDSMGPSGKNHLRISFCAPPATIHTAFDRLDSYFK